MATRQERERLQRMNEKHKNILAVILSREENKFCADCLSKGPRWASWNLGVLLCIRCSGLHRSMGVHISRVKSVNLDTWTREQMLNFCSRGNGWAKDMYEAKLPNDFRRPQTDSSMEYFIRDKYEKKKYSSGVAVELRPLTGLGLLENEPPKKTSRRSDRSKENVSIVSIPKPKGLRPVSPGIPRPKSLPQLPKHDDSPVQPRAQNHAQGPTTDDLLGLSSPISKNAPVSVNVDAAPPPSSDLTEDLFGPLSSFQSLSMTTSVSSPDLLNGGETNAAMPQETTVSAAESVEDKKLSKDSILSLYSQGTKTSPMAAGNFNLTSQANIGYQQQPMQYNQQSFPGMNMQAMQGMPVVYQQGQQAAYQQQSSGYQQQPGGYQQHQMTAMQHQQQQLQMHQMAQQMSNMNMGGMGYGQMPQQPQNAMQNNVGYPMAGYNSAQLQANQSMYNSMQQQSLYGGAMVNGNAGIAQMGGYNAMAGGMMQNQAKMAENTWGVGTVPPTAAGIGSGHTLSTQLWK